LEATVVVVSNLMNIYQSAATIFVTTTNFVFGFDFETPYCVLDTIIAPIDG